MVKVINFEIKDTLKRQPFQKNDKIEQIYFDLAEYALATLYKIYPFKSCFEAASLKDENEQFKSCMMTWADYFMVEGMSCKAKLTEAINKVVSLGRMFPPSLPEIIHAYHGNLQKLRDNSLVQYALYIRSKCQYEYRNHEIVNGHIGSDAKPFDIWTEETSNELNI